MPQGSPRRSSSRVSTALAQQVEVFDVVRVRHAPPGSGLAAGAEGTVVDIFDDRTLLIDFSGASGAESHGDDPVHVLAADQVTLVRKLRGP